MELRDFLAPGNLALLERMAGLMVHRGPDDSGYWLSASLAHGFAHRRLSILDLSERGHQPMLDERGLAVACYNGEIYNFAELRKDLVDRGWQFRSTSDTEVLLKGYLEYGRDIVAKLNGIFAFAIHDLRSGETFIARDQLGVKPLYLAGLTGTVLFASELKSLLADARVSRDLDSVALHRYLTFLWSPGHATAGSAPHGARHRCTGSGRKGDSYLEVLPNFFSVVQFACRSRTARRCRAAA